MKADGSLINDLDLFHHRPYECLLLGHCHREVSAHSAVDPAIRLCCLWVWVA